MGVLVGPQNLRSQRAMEAELVWHPGPTPMAATALSTKSLLQPSPKEEPNANDQSAGGARVRETIASIVAHRTQETKGFRQERSMVLLIEMRIRFSNRSAGR